jgi:hypothetical protein
MDGHRAEGGQALAQITVFGVGHEAAQGLGSEEGAKRVVQKGVGAHVAEQQHQTVNVQVEGLAERSLATRRTS